MKEVLAEVPNVRKDAGYPPLVTPSSQIVGTQAVFNVMMGRYKVMTGEFADLMLGYYGETIGPRDRRRDRTGRRSTPKKDPITCRPADLLKPEWDELRAAALALNGLQRLGRGRPDLRDVPAGGAEVLRHPRRRAEEPGQGSRTPSRPQPPRRLPAAPAPDNGKGPVRTRSPTT